MSVRVTLANITAADLAGELQRAGLSGTVFASIGAGSWGVEPGATFETVTGGTLSTGYVRIRAFVRSLLRERREECAYLTHDGTSAWLVYQAVPAPNGD